MGFSGEVNNINILLSVFNLEVLSLSCTGDFMSFTFFTDNLTGQLERLRRQVKMVFSIVRLFLLEAWVTCSGAGVTASFCQSQGIALVKLPPQLKIN